MMVDYVIASHHHICLLGILLKLMMIMIIMNCSFVYANEYDQCID